MEPVTLETERLVLRPWRASDLEPFAAMNADPVVMEHLPTVLDRAGSDAFVARIEAEFDQRGWGLWAVEVPGTAPFIGYVGLHDAADVLGRPAVEVGWRLAAAHWGRGYASEAGGESLRFAFEDAGLSEVVSFTIPDNVRSQAVMRRIGMAPAGEFDHPRFGVGSRFRRHVLYVAGGGAHGPLEPGVTPR